MSGARRIELPQRPRILVITLRRLGDVLLSTPLLRTIRRGFAQATLHALVFSGSERVLAGNPDIDDVLTIAERPSAGATLALLRRLWRRYDLVVSTQTGDRPAFLAWVAGRRRLGLVPRAGETGAWWKRQVHHVAIDAEPGRHRVVQLLALASAIGLDPVPQLVCPRGAPPDRMPSRRYAVLHASPFYRYKRWTDAGWRRLARELAERGLALVATGGPDPSEKAYLDGLWGEAGVPIDRVDGRLDWPQLAALLAGAEVYVGPDTSMTHLAAGSGCPTVALYGPTSPRLIGPWPTGGLERPWDHAGSIQHRGNVWVVQNPLPCLPCEKLGCEGRLDSRSQCLDELSTERVLLAVDDALKRPARRPH
ncbi:MAG TPA: glycosyltransferase family 9 protein [Xanthobacteraceae bacterium]